MKFSPQLFQAINRQYFWDLGGYDEELLIWNGENYELSFKLHLCGGELLEVPCSRVAHTFRKHNNDRVKTGVDFVGRNFKRVAEVWLDEYKEILYSGEPARYASIDAGDLTKQKAIRKNLNCKPFQYYLDYIAPDMLERLHLLYKTILILNSQYYLYLEDFVIVMKEILLQEPL